MVINVPKIVKFLHPNAIPNVDFRINRRAGEDAPFTIVAWDAKKLGPQPTEEQLAEVAESVEFLDWFLGGIKAKRHAEIDAKTQQVISLGFNWQNSTFSLSSNAQLNWTNLFVARAILDYPVTVSTLDSGSRTLASANEVAAFYSVGIAHVKAIIDAGRGLKELVSAARTEAEVSAVVDSR